MGDVHICLHQAVRCKPKCWFHGIAGRASQRERLQPVKSIKEGLAGRLLLCFIPETIYPVDQYTGVDVVLVLVRFRGGCGLARVHPSDIPGSYVLWPCLVQLLFVEKAVYLIS
jgi:hypothetical protein